jgi:hypothetical protein
MIRDGANASFLRAPRQEGAKPFRLVEGPPEATAYGEDVYERIFGVPPTELVRQSRSRGSGFPLEQRLMTRTEKPTDAGTAPRFSSNSVTKKEH